MRKLQLIVLASLIKATSCYAQIPARPATWNGKILYEDKCIRCHGQHGDQGTYGAKDLRRSKLTDEQYLTIISNGKWFMPRWKKKLSRDQIQSIISYIKTLKN